MTNGWSSYEEAAKRGPMPIFRKVLITLAIMTALATLVGIPLGWYHQAAKIAVTEFGPEQMLKKYEWFKDAAAQLDKKRADIEVYQSRLTNMEVTYEDVSRLNWPREDREQYNTWQSEVAGVKASYNSLAAEYNAQMAKFNWRFTNVGDLPAGATEPLPREYKPYVTD